MGPNDNRVFVSTPIYKPQTMNTSWAEEEVEEVSKTIEIFLAEIERNGDTSFHASEPPSKEKIEQGRQHVPTAVPIDLTKRSTSTGRAPEVVTQKEPKSLPTTNQHQQGGTPAGPFLGQQATYGGARPKVPGMTVSQRMQQIAEPGRTFGPQQAGSMNRDNTRQPQAQPQRQRDYTRQSGAQQQKQRDNIQTTNAAKGTQQQQSVQQRQQQQRPQPTQSQAQSPNPRPGTTGPLSSNTTVSGKAATAATNNGGECMVENEVYDNDQNEHPFNVVSHKRERKRKRSRSNPNTYPPLRAVQSNQYRNIFVRDLSTEGYENKDVMEDAIINYCEERGVGIFFIRIMTRKSEPDVASIKISVADEDADTVLDPAFWPRHATVREWRPFNKEIAKAGANNDKGAFGNGFK